MLGQRLLELGLVTEEQLLAALDAQEARAPSLHRLAVEAGALSIQGALEFLEMRARGDERSFELIAQEQLWLTSRDIEGLYRLRAARRPKIGEVLTRLGFVSAAQLQEVLASLAA